LVSLFVDRTMLHVVVSSFGNTSDHFPVFGLPGCVATSGLRFCCSGFVVAVETSSRFLCHEQTKSASSSSFCPTLREAVVAAAAPWLEMSRAFACLQPRLHKLCRLDEHWDETRWSSLKSADGIPEGEGVFRTGEYARQVVVYNWGDAAAAVALAGADGSPVWLLPGLLVRKILNGKDVFIRMAGQTSYFIWSAQKGIAAQPKEGHESLDLAWERAGIPKQEAGSLGTILVQLRDEIEKLLPPLPKVSSNRKNFVHDLLDDEDDVQLGAGDGQSGDMIGGDGTKVVWKSNAVEVLSWGTEIFPLHEFGVDVCWRKGLLLRRRTRNKTWLYFFAKWSPETGPRFAVWSQGMKEGEETYVCLFF
jgi:hypothetical protein